MPRYNISTGSRPDRAAAQQQQDMQQQQLDQSGQSAALSQIMQLYGLQQQTQLAPEHLHSLQLENKSRDLANAGAQQNLDWNPYERGLTARGHEQTLDQQGKLFPGQMEAQNLANTGLGQENDWRPTLDQARYDATQAATGHDEASRFKDALVLRQMNLINDDELMMHAPPDIRAQHEQRKMLEDAARAKAVAADQAQQGSAAPVPPVTGREGGILPEPYNPYNTESVMTHQLGPQGAQDFQHQLVTANNSRHAKMSPEDIYNEQHPIHGLYNFLFGNPTTAKPRP